MHADRCLISPTAKELSTYKEMKRWQNPCSMDKEIASEVDSARNMAPAIPAAINSPRCLKYFISKYWENYNYDVWALNVIEFLMVPAVREIQKYLAEKSQLLLPASLHWEALKNFTLLNNTREDRVFVTTIPVSCPAATKMTSGHGVYLHQLNSGCQCDVHLCDREFR